jgi:NDP-sugar pyrophosphorylase family protein
MREAIILAGGLGTRLQHLVPDLPKALAPINGRPFLEYMLEYLITQKVEHFIFAVSHKKEELKKYLSINYPQLKISYAEEETPLGTGGAILNAIDLVKSNAFFVFNADTYFPIDINSLEIFAIEHHYPN